jgi:hypothetical protein
LRPAQAALQLAEHLGPLLASALTAFDGCLKTLASKQTKLLQQLKSAELLRVEFCSS